MALTWCGGFYGCAGPDDPYGEKVGEWQHMGAAGCQGSGFSVLMMLCPVQLYRRKNGDPDGCQPEHQQSDGAGHAGLPPAQHQALPCGTDPQLGQPAPPVRGLSAQERGFAKLKLFSL